MSDKKRCSWCQDNPLLTEYHDSEWGIAPETDDELFERMSMQIFQAGLNWQMILQKRANIREAFDGFRIELVAGYDDIQFNRLLKIEGIIRNRRKIKSIIENAKILSDIQKKYGSVRNYIDNWPEKLSLIQKETGNTFRFMGPEITRMFVMNIGKIPPPHEPGCWRFHDSKKNY